MVSYFTIDLVVHKDFLVGFFLFLFGMVTSQKNNPKTYAQTYPLPLVGMFHDQDLLSFE